MLSISLSRRFPSTRILGLKFWNVCTPLWTLAACPRYTTLLPDRCCLSFLLPTLLGWSLLERFRCALLLTVQALCYFWVLPTWSTGQFMQLRDLVCLWVLVIGVSKCFAIGHPACEEKCVCHARPVRLVCASHLLAAKDGCALFSSLASRLQCLCLLTCFLFFYKYAVYSMHHLCRSNSTAS